ncbi:hypothetical protein PV11_08615 [Exophiala sideris]|uniref:Uncharacterized protein n=1 Tax=Exophiala sideris TaxID=1016849 RepID=A0A0D1Z2S2_9EURO|nr:hypothetical protein PV11_08615 [Exophiala sideris]
MQEEGENIQVHEAEARVEMAHLVGGGHEVNQAPGDDLVEVPLAAPPTTLHPSSKMSIIVHEQDGSQGRGRDPALTLRLLVGRHHLPTLGLLHGMRNQVR